jgi:polyferredoxin
MICFIANVKAATIVRIKRAQRRLTVDDRRPLKSPSRRRQFSTRRLRFYAQIFAAVITLWIGVEFILFVRYLESGGEAMYVPRPPGVEAFLPISGLISLRDWFITSVLNSIHPASMIILLVIVVSAFVFKKGFCSWVCPVGFISEMVGNIGDGIIKALGIKRRLKLPRLLDYPLRSLKYILLGFFIYAVFFAMSSAAIHAFVASPYNKVADIKMLKFFTEIDSFGLWTIIILFAFSIFLRGFWCRYLCPYGALLGLASLFGTGKIKRDTDACISCGKCARACPAFIKVDQIAQVRSDECTGCLDCIDVCPVKGALEPYLAGRKRRISKKAWAISFLIVFWGSLLLFKFVGPWENSITTQEYQYHMERMDGPEYTHPGR